MSKTVKLTQNFNSTKQIGIVILDDDAKIHTGDIISFEFFVAEDKKFRLTACSLISGEGYCKFREDNKTDIEKLKDAEVVLQEAKTAGELLNQIEKTETV